MSEDLSALQAIKRLLVCAVVFKQTARRLEKWADGDTSYVHGQIEQPRYFSLVSLQDSSFRDAMISLESLSPEMYKGVTRQFDQLIREAAHIDSITSLLLRVMIEGQATELAGGLRLRASLLKDQFHLEKASLVGQSTGPEQVKRKQRKPVKKAIMFVLTEHPDTKSLAKLLQLVNAKLDSMGHGPTTYYYLKKCLPKYTKEHEQQKKVE